MFKQSKKDGQEKESLLRRIRSLEKELETKVIAYQKSSIQKFPFIFLGLSTIGGVAIFYGFEQLIARSDYLADKPLVLISVGFIILVATGALYKKLNSL